jgi:hypothetical protein
MKMRHPIHPKIPPLLQRAHLRLPLLLLLDHPRYLRCCGTLLEILHENSQHYHLSRIYIL